MGDGEGSAHMNASLATRSRCRPGMKTIYWALCVAALFIVISTQLRVELAGKRIRLHLPAGMVTVFRSTLGFPDHHAREEISL